MAYSCIKPLIWSVISQGNIMITANNLSLSYPDSPEGGIVILYT